MHPELSMVRAIPDNIQYIGLNCEITGGGGGGQTFTSHFIHVQVFHFVQSII